LSADISSAYLNARAVEKVDIPLVPARSLNLTKWVIALSLLCMSYMDFGPVAMHGVNNCPLHNEAMVTSHARWIQMCG
jgi:hypothetical protein